MGQVTGYTAERMKAIEDASIVNGDIDASGHLILTRFDESQIDAGVILTSPKIVTSGTRPTGDDLFDGLMIYETNTNRLYVWEGTAWEYKGGVVICTSATRPSTPFAGLEIYETDTNRVLFYSGTQWRRRGTQWDRNGSILAGPAHTAADEREAELWIQSGSQVATTSLGGDIAITFPTPFGVSLFTVIACPGDGALGFYLCQPVGSTYALTGCDVRCRNNTGAVIASTSLRVNWIALGL